MSPWNKSISILSLLPSWCVPPSGPSILLNETATYKKSLSGCQVKCRKQKVTCFEVKWQTKATKASEMHLLTETAFTRTSRPQLASCCEKKWTNDVWESTFRHKKTELFVLWHIFVQFSRKFNNLSRPLYRISFKHVKSVTIYLFLVFL